MFNGTVSGTYREVQEPTRIVQDWRFNHWPDGVLSKVCVRLEGYEHEHSTTQPVQWRPNAMRWTEMSSLHCSCLCDRWLLLLPGQQRHDRARASQPPYTSDDALAGTL